MKRLLVLISLFFSTQSFCADLFQEYYKFNGELKLMPGTVPMIKAQYEKSLYNSLVHILDVSCDREFISLDKDEKLDKLCQKVEKMPYQTIEQKRNIVSIYKKYSCKHILERFDDAQSLSDEEKKLRFQSCVRGAQKLPASYAKGRSIAATNSPSVNELSSELSSFDFETLVVD